MLSFRSKGRPIADKHPNKHVRKAVKAALDLGWRLKKAKGKGHRWGRLFCPYGKRGGCIVGVDSTPAIPESHAADIEREVANCPH